jgi:SAM-dependent methyltransferase
MTEKKSHHPADQSAQQKLATEILRPLMAKRRPGRVLVLKHAGAGDLALDTVSPVQIVRLSADRNSESARVRCRLEALPFEQSVFDLVVLHHLVCDGSDVILAQALHVLVPGGDIVISGLNASGLRYHLANRDNSFPGLRLSKTCNHLQSRSFKIRHCLMSGLAGLSKPAANSRWHEFGLPFSDRVVLQGRHQGLSNNSTVLRFKSVHPAGVVSASLDGCSSREAAS